MQRFWNKVNVGEPDECWEWRAGKITFGYGRFLFNKKNSLAHRVSWIITNGPIPKGEGYHGICVLHKCDNPSCVNPNHLFLGTMGDNSRDMVMEGRANCTGLGTNLKKGEDHGRAKVTKNQVIEIRQRYESEDITQKQLAREYGLGAVAINYIINNKNWRHVK